MSSGAAARDRGSATVWAVTAISVLLLVTAAMSLVGAAITARHRAGTAADGAALAAALDVVDGPVEACAAAGVAAARDGAEVTGCAVAGPYAQVSVSVSLAGRLASFGVATAHARAGPAGRL